MIKMRKKRLECQTRGESNTNAKRRNQNLLDQIMEQPTDYGSVEMDSPPHDPGTSQSMNNMSNDGLMLQRRTETDELQQALKLIEEMTSKMTEKEKQCEELECVVVKLDSRVKEMESVIITLKAELESTVVALDASRKGLQSTLTKCTAKIEELELQISEFCKQIAELEERNIELKKGYEA